jgi:DNA primase
MKEWLTDHLISCADEIPESAEGHCLGRGLPFRLLREMQVGLWSPSDRDAPDPTFRQRYGNRGGELDGWISVPMWSPRGKVVGVEFRRWDGEKGSQKFFLPDSRWLPVFTGLVPSVLNRIWKGGDVWLVEGLFDLSIAHAIPKKDVALACGGAKITPNQLTFLRRFLSDKAWVHVCFDMDETGQNMAHGYIHPDTGKRVWGVSERIARAGMHTRVVRYRGGKDPGEIWDSGGSAALKTAFSL